MLGEFKTADEKSGSPIIFLAPESIGQDFVLTDTPPPLSEIQNVSDWDVALRYHEFKSNPAYQEVIKQLRHISARAVLRKAQAVLGSVVKPKWVRSVPLVDMSEMSEFELDLDETLESSPLLMHGQEVMSSEDLWIEKSESRQQPLVIAVDTSLSMTGEKLALTAVALSVVLLEFPDDPIGIVAFENKAKVVKQPYESITVYELVERFLDIPAQGYTHLEDGIKESIHLLSILKRLGGERSRPASLVLLTDGKYTAGRDPSYLAPQIGHLLVLKMGKDRASLALCQELARLGSGSMKEVEDLQVLPGVMYSLVKDLLRGRSLR